MDHQRVAHEALPLHAINPEAVIFVFLPGISALFHLLQLFR